MYKRKQTCMNAHFLENVPDTSSPFPTSADNQICIGGEYELTVGKLKISPSNPSVDVGGIGLAGTGAGPKSLVSWENNESNKTEIIFR